MLIPERFVKFMAMNRTENELKKVESNAYLTLTLCISSTYFTSINSNFYKYEKM